MLGCAGSENVDGTPCGHVRGVVDSFYDLQVADVFTFGGVEFALQLRPPKKKTPANLPSFCFPSSMLRINSTNTPKK